MAKISTIFGLSKTQGELDFVNIDPSKDLPLFIDPYYLSLRKDDWSVRANATIKSFFQLIVDLIRAGKLDQAHDLFRNLGEPNETCLGLSSDKPQGRGVGPFNSEDIFESIIESRAVELGIVNSLEDCALFVDGVARDKISDMSTNIIRKQIIEYTQSQCNLWEIPLAPGIQSGFYWNHENMNWENTNCPMLVVSGKRILLVPKSIVSYSDSYTGQKYHQHFVLNFLKEDHLRRDTSLVRKRYNKKGELVRRWVSKREVKEKEAPLSKEFLRTFTTKHPQILELFKSNSKMFIKPIKDIELEDFNEIDLADALISTLKTIEPGRDQADNYNKLIAGIVEFIFHPKLICPQVERDDHNGRKRIDIIFTNAAEEGFFSELHMIHKVPCSYIIIECKNYNDDLANKELDQLSGRFGPNKGQFGLLISRKVDNYETLMHRCADTNRDKRGKIIPLFDEDIIGMLTKIKGGDRQRIEEVLYNRFRDINFD